MKRYLIEIIVIVIISASYGFAAYHRNFVWEDNFSLWSDIVWEIYLKTHTIIKLAP